MIKKWYNLISVITGIVFLIGIYQYVIQTRTVRLSEYITEIGVGKLLLASIFYLISHLLRGLRIAVMVAREDISLRSIIRTQYFTNGVNLVLPFKLGEFFRLYEFHKLIRKYQISVAAIIAEKSIDFCFLFLGLILSFYIAGDINLNLNYTLLGCGMFLLLIAFSFFVLPENIRSFNLFIAKRYSKEFFIKLLAFTSKVYSIISNMRQILKEKSATLILCTILIWGFEVLAFIFFIRYLPQSNIVLLLSFLVFLSIFIPSGSLGIGGVQLAFYCIYLIDNKFPFLELSLVYQIFLFLPAIIISLIILAIHKYPEVKEIWKSTYSKPIDSEEGSVLTEGEDQTYPLSFFQRIIEVFKYFKIKYL